MEKEIYCLCVYSGEFEERKCDFAHFKEKPSVGTLRDIIGPNCSFKEAFTIHWVEPDPDSYAYMLETGEEVFFYKLEDKHLERETTDELVIFYSDQINTSRFLKFRDEFKEKYKEELNSAPIIKDVLDYLDFVLFDWYEEMYYDDTHEFNIDNFKKYFSSYYDEYLRLFLKAK